MTPYCATADNIERRATDLLQVSQEKMASALRLKAMAWQAKSEKVHHEKDCEVCQPLLGVM